MAQQSLIQAHQNRIAELVPGPSTLRGYPKGTLAVCKRYLAHINLKDFFVSLSNENYQKFLDYHTLQLESQLTEHSNLNANRTWSYWGGARKILNLFGRDILYNKILVDSYANTYEYEKLLQQLEVPLDSQVAAEIITKTVDCNLIWAGLNKLDLIKSQEFQNAAKKLLAPNECVVNLDLIFWRKSI